MSKNLLQKLSKSELAALKRAAAADRERESRQSLLRAEELTFGPQKDFIEDTERFVAACCSRRAGKTYGIALKLLLAGYEHPGSLPLYVTRAREMAKNILHPVLREIDRNLGLGLHFRENNGDVVLPNDSTILLRGADTEREMGKLRGMKYPIAVIDEAQDFGELLIKLINEAIEPATSDYMGQIYLTGTPNAACMGPYYDALHDRGEMRGWSTHHWTILDNPHHPGKEAYLADVRRKRNWAINHPSYLREYCGVWVKDSNAMVFPSFSEARNVAELPELPEGEEWSYVLGCDVGYNDPTAYVVLAYNAALGRLFVVESYEDSREEEGQKDVLSKLGVTPVRFATEVKQLNDHYDFEAIVIDTGGMGKAYAETLTEQYGINFVAAEKQKRLAYIKLLDGDMRTGKVAVCPDNSKLIEDIQLMQWDVDKAAKGRWVFDSKSDKNDHLVDALLYGWRYCYHHDLSWEEEPSVPGTLQWVEEAIERHWERLDKEIEQSKRSMDDPWHNPYPDM